MSAGLRRLLILVIAVQTLGLAVHTINEWGEIRRGEIAPIVGVMLVLAGAMLLVLLVIQAFRAQIGGRREVEQRLEIITEKTPTVVWTTDRDLRLTSIVGPMIGPGGLDPAQILGLRVVDVGVEAGVQLPSSYGAANLVADYEAALRGESVANRATWGGRLYEAKIEPLRDESGQVSGTIVVAQDITERELAQSELRAREREFATLVENLPDAIIRIDRDLRHLNANRAVSRAIGLRPEDILGKTVLEMGLPSDLAETWKQHLVRVFDTGITETFESGFESPRGLRYLEAQVVPERDDAGRVVSVLLVVRDATERRRAEKSVRESEERFRVTFDNTPSAILVVDREWRVQTANAATAAMLGYSVEELPGKMIRDFVHPDDGDVGQSERERLIAGEIPVARWERRFIRKDGGIVWGRIAASRVRGEDGEAALYVVQGEDITELKRAEQALREQEALQRTVIESATDIIGVVDREGLVRLASRSVSDSLGYEPEELIGRLFSELIHPDDRPEIEERILQLMAGEPPAARMRTVRVLHKNGEWRLLEATGAVSFDEGGAPLFVVLVLRDVSERMLLERQLRRTRAMEAIGQLAGGVAHDFNNLLTAVNGYADIALQKLGEEGDSELRSYLAEIRRGGERAAELTQRLLAFSGQQVLHPEILDLNAVVAEYEGVLGHLLGTDIELVTKLKRDLGTIETDPDQLGQVLTSLAMNAREAMSGGGTLEISTESVTLEPPFPHIHGALRSGSYAVLSLTDTGEGIDPETREHLFEPFFTTKKTGGGGGLGLAAVLGIVEQSGGAIEVFSEPGAGATFKLYFPISGGRVRERKERAAESEPGGAAILVVEDDEAVRNLVAKMLAESEYLVHVAATPTEALELARSSIPIDALVTDVVLPEMNGHELAQKIRSLRPGLRVLYTSGYAPEAVRDRGVLEREEEFIQKPFSAKALIGAVNRILE